MATIRYPTANSKTPIAYETEWLVLDVGSGHSPHPRADILVDRFLSDHDGEAGRSGRALENPEQKPLVIADITALPFVENTFDFVICSHVLEHIENVDGACMELNRIGQRGYIETPSKFTELLRHAPYHIWFVSRSGNDLRFEAAPTDHPLGFLGKLFFSLYFYQTHQLQGKNVFHFAFGVKPPLHSLLVFIRRSLRRFWTKNRSLTYTRLQWTKPFMWSVNQ